jgi:PAS domain-containing protein
MVDWYLQQSGTERVSERYAFFFRGLQGEPHQAEVEVLVQQEGESLRRYLLFHDTTDYNRLDQEVRVLRRQLDTGTPSSHPALLSLDLQGTVVACSETAAKLLDAPREEAIGHPLWEVMGQAEGSNLLPEAIARAYREGHDYVEVSWPTKESGLLGITLALLLGEADVPTGIAVLLGPARTTSTDT